MTKVAPVLTHRERRFLAIVYPTGSVGIGLTVGEKLYVRGFLKIEHGRYSITPAGAEAIRRYPESLFTIGGRPR